MPKNSIAIAAAAPLHAKSCNIALLAEELIAKWLITALSVTKRKKRKTN
ncbi:Uncharacterised protein [Klebsiella oxytoca]|uniref:Uncharacterized protein n=1 Tax=Klebsiella spallanzanii TaxID=2587528 RepID=A0A564L5W6_9ENTR|nr:hypothetical protein AI2744V1_3755 [Klebsiella oxytoca]VUS76918.1 hypothetical protein SB6408_05310 [Klebsiella spallanzanii]CAH5322918.1 hypothetical protein AI2744V1_3755 [Klebsiella oxytoca]CAH5675793.1 hypothetical protein AI3012V1_2365 [Klebsiella oxytoca]SAP55562.1 Uncharacterised protein [Klebsiella oxytoca]